MHIAKTEVYGWKQAAGEFWELSGGVLNLVMKIDHSAGTS
jgi:hypothetical protein